MLLFKDETHFKPAIQSMQRSGNQLLSKVQYLHEQVDEIRVDIRKTSQDYRDTLNDGSGGEAGCGKVLCSSCYNFLRPLHKDAYKAALEAQASEEASRAVVQAMDQVYFCAI